MSVVKNISRWHLSVVITSVLISIYLMVLTGVFLYGNFFIAAPLIIDLPSHLMTDEILSSNSEVLNLIHTFNILALTTLVGLVIVLTGLAGFIKKKKWAPLLLVGYIFFVLSKISSLSLSDIAEDSVIYLLFVILLISLIKLRHEYGVRLKTIIFSAVVGILVSAFLQILTFGIE